MYGGGGHYDGNGGGGGAANAYKIFGGGGNMPSQTTNTPEGSSGITKTRGDQSQTLLPLTVKQIMEASQANDNRSSFAVNGTEVSMTRENETFDTEEMKSVKDGDYVVVSGGLKGFQGKRQVVAYSVRLVTNYNNITHHFLECINVHLYLARQKRSLSQSQINANASTWNQAPPPNKAPPSTASRNTAGKELPDLVMSVFHDPVLGNLEHGVSVDHVASRLKLSDGLARSTVLHLVDLGNLYATIDENHYKSTLNG